MRSVRRFLPLLVCALVFCRLRVISGQEPWADVPDYSKMTPTQKQRIAQRDEEKKLVRQVYRKSIRDAGNLIRDMYAKDIEVFGADHEECARTIQYYIDTMVELKQFESMVELLKIELSVYQKQFGPDNWRSASAHNKLTIFDLLHSKGNEQVRNLYIQAIFERDKSLGSWNPATQDDYDHLTNGINMFASSLQAVGIAPNANPEIAVCLLHRSNMEIYRNNYAEAARDAKRALDILDVSIVNDRNEKILGYGRVHPMYVEGLMRLADARSRQGQIREAERLYRQAFDILSQCYARPHRSKAAALTGLAVLATQRQDDVESLELHKQATKELDGSEGVPPAQRVDELAALSDCYRRLSKHDEALKAALEAVRYANQTISTAPLYFARAKFSEAFCYMTMQKLSEAIAAFNESATYYHRHGGADSPLYGFAANLLGQCYFLSGNMDQAESYMEGSIPLLIRRLGPDHNDVRLCANRYQELLIDRCDKHLAKGDFQGARQAAQENVDLMLKAIGKSSVWSIAASERLKTLDAIERLSPEARTEVVKSFAQLRKASTEYEKSQFSESVALAQQALEVQLRYLPDAKYYVSRSRCILGLSLFELGNVATADEQLQVAVRQMSDLYGKTSCSEGAMATAALVRIATLRNDLDAADAWFNVADVLIPVFYGDDSIPNAQLKKSAAQMLVKRGKLIDAEIMQREAREILNRRVEHTSPLHRELTAELAWTIARLGQFEEAQVHFQKLAESHGSGEVNQAEPKLPFAVNMQHAALRFDRERSDESLKGLRVLVNSPPSTATAFDQILGLIELANRERRRGQFSECHLSCLKAIAIATEQHAPANEAFTLVTEINPEMMKEWIITEHLDSGIDNQEKLLSMLSGKFGPTDWRTIQIQHGLSTLQSVAKLTGNQIASVRAAIDVGNVAQALRDASQFSDSIERVEAARKHWRGIDVSPILRDSLDRLHAELLAATGQYSAANDLWAALINTSEKTLPDHPWLARLLNDAGFSSLEQADLKLAEQRFQRATQIISKSSAAILVEAGRAQIGLALACLNTGRYVESLEFLRAAERSLTPFQLTTPEVFHELLSAKAEYRLALDIRPKDGFAIARSFAEKHCDPNSIALGRSGYLQCRGVSRDVARGSNSDMKPASEITFRQAVELFRQKVGPKSIGYARAKLGLASFLIDQKKFDEADNVTDQAVTIIRNAVGPDHPLEIESLQIQSRIAASRNQPSIEFLNRALEIARKKPNTDLLAHIGLLTSAADVAMQQKDSATARSLIMDGLQKSIDLIERSEIIQTEDQQLQMIERLRPVFNRYLAWNLDHLKPDELYNVVLRWKGIQIAHQLRFLQGRRTLNDPEQATQWERLTDRLVGAATRVPYPEEQAFWRRQVQYLANSRDDLELQIRRSSPGKLACPTAQDLIDDLPDNVVLLDYIRYENPLRAGQPREDDKRNFNYAVFVLRHRAPVVIANLGDAKVIDETVQVWRKTSKELTDSLTHVSDVPVERGQELAKVFEGSAFRLQELLWSSVQAAVGDAKTVLVSPDGLLGSFPFSAIPDMLSNGFLVQKHQFVVVLAPRLLPELLKQSPRAKRNDDLSVALFGGIDFDASPERREEAIPDLPQPKEQGTSMTLGSSAFGPTSGAGLNLTFLPGTLLEVDKISALISTLNPTAKIDKFTGKRASENEYRRQLVNHRWLHLATHGFFIDNLMQDAQVRNGNTTSVRGVAVAPREAQELPEILSRFDLTTGLSFTGGNQANSASEDDGILWGMEVAARDLSGIELAILSGCDTSSGRIFEGEGALSMQRSFQLAGARSILSTLWPIDDFATSLFMERFYRNSLRDGMSHLEAMRETQLWFLEASRRSVIEKVKPGEDSLTIESAHLPPTFMLPSFWAPFVINGDWR